MAVPGIGTQQTSFIAQTLYHHSLLFLTVPLSVNSAWKPKGESTRAGIAMKNPESESYTALWLVGMIGRDVSEDLEDQ